jgi:7,8-dihydropterin-6-yl-methyl-4-(beta-D-ribofuranosyl)aminobenzene 5'-phosphate synthase
MKKITCVVDNTAQRSSQFWGEHGLAFWIETEKGAALLALSHAHVDHTGGLRAVLSHTSNLPIYANADLPRPRYSLSEGEYKSIGLSISLEELTQRAKLHFSDSSAEVLPGLWTTGEVLERLEPEGRSPNHFIHVDDEWHPDPYRDDMSLVMDTQEGLVVICGCCHAGLLNTLAHVKKVFQRPITAVLGGTHLVAADEAYLEHVSNVLREQYDPLYLYLNHCTGERAYVAMANAFGDRANQCPVGTTVMFS